MTLVGFKGKNHPQQIDRNGARDDVDDRGDLWVPPGRFKDWYDRPLSLWRPTHWPHYLRSRLTGKLGFIEHV